MRRMILFLFVSSWACLTTACIGHTPVSETNITYEVRDAPSEGKIYITYTNATSRAMCFGPNSWPSNGILINNGEEITISADGRVFFLNAEQDYCPNCQTRVEVGQKS